MPSMLLLLLYLPVTLSCLKPVMEVIACFDKSLDWSYLVCCICEMMS